MEGLIVHRGGRELTRPELAALPPPQSMGRHHKPIPHFEVVEALYESFPKFDLEPEEDGWAVSGDLGKLFGVVRFRRQTAIAATKLLLGIRTSTDESIALQGVAGAHVFVCDNMAFSGQEFIFKRKSTTHAVLTEIIYEGMVEFGNATMSMEEQFAKFERTGIEDIDASKLLVQMIRDEVIPDRYVAAGARAYFNFEPEHVDVAPRTIWGLFNAMTRGLRKVPVNAKLSHTQAVTRFLRDAA